MQLAACLAALQHAGRVEQVILEAPELVVGKGTLAMEKLFDRGIVLPLLRQRLQTVEGAGMQMADL